MFWIKRASKFCITKKKSVFSGTKWRFQANRRIF